MKQLDQNSEPNQQRKTSLVTFYKNSLKNQILIPFILLIMLTGGIVSFVSYTFSVNKTTDELANGVESQMVTMNDTFEMFFSNIRSIMNRFTSNELVLNYQPKDTQKLLQFLRETNENTPSLSNLYIGTEAGDFINALDLGMSSHYVIKETPWYVSAVEAEGDVVWTEPYTDEGSGETVITASQAYYRDNQLIGVMGADIHIDTLTDMIGNITIGKNGYAIIVGEAGEVVAHPDEEYIGVDESGEEYYKKIAEADERGIIEYQFEKEKKMMGFAKNPSTGWILAGTVHVNDFKEQARSIIFPILTCLLIVLGLAIVISLVTTGRIIKQIKIVMERMKSIASGNLTQPHLEMTSQDEIGQLVKAINNMSDHMRTLLNQINLVSETVTSQSEELTQSAGEVKEASEQISSTMHELASGSETQANSSSDLSLTMQKFSHEIERVEESSKQIQLSSNNMLSATEEGTHLMHLSKEQMGKVDQIVHDSVDKVTGLDKQAQEISKLVGVIQDIAAQTNLLALNAAIEAARAGENGKGFAVVADEVRKLAEQVSDSVTDITKIVTTIQNESSHVVDTLQTGYQEVENGTHQIEVTGEKFNEINAAINQMADHINVVYENIASISSRSQEMNRAVEDIAATSEESAAGIEETSAASQQTSASMEAVADNSNDLSMLAEKLNKLVQQFRL